MFRVEKSFSSFLEVDLVVRQKLINILIRVGLVDAELLWLVRGKGVKKVDYLFSSLFLLIWSFANGKECVLLINERFSHLLVHVFALALAEALDYID